MLREPTIAQSVFSLGAPDFAFRWAVCLVCAVGLVAALPARAQTAWPTLTPTREIGGGEKDAAVVAAAERYAFVASVPGAVRNGRAWYEHLTRNRKVPFERARLLRDHEVTVEKLEKALARAAAAVSPGGTLWVVFVGHGAPSPDGDGLLVGIDAQQDAESLVARSLRRTRLLELALGSKATRVVAVLDACFSGRTADGKPLVPGLQPLVVVRELPVAPRPAERETRLVLLTAAKSTELAGPLPGGAWPAFSYLALGALRGWADADGDGAVTARELHQYTVRALQGLLIDRTQTPTLEAGAPGEVLGPAWEKGPDLAALVASAAPGSRSGPTPAMTTPASGSATAVQPGGAVIEARPAADLGTPATIPAGPFVRGSDNGDADERPARQETLPAFALDRTEVTRGAWAACVSAGRCPPLPGALGPDPRVPMTGVTWHESRAFCAAAGKRLPTEAEWEKAARGPDGRTHPWGEGASCLRANHDICAKGGPVPVGTLPQGQSPYGVHDLSGNVWEWVEDAYAGGPFKVIRGGAFDTPAATLRASYRGRADPASRHHNVGFRCAKDP